MIFNVDRIDHIYIAAQAVDFRKSINGLVGIIENQFYMSSTNNTLFVFTNKRKTSIKMIYFDLNGYWVFQKVLMNHDKFQWIKEDTRQTISISKEQLSWLLNGMDMSPKHHFKSAKPHVF